MQKEFELIKKKPNYQVLVKKYFKLPTYLQKMNYSAQENILRENFKFLDSVIIPLSGDAWEFFKSLLKLVENMKPGSLIEICKLAISDKFDVISEHLPKSIVEKELILIIDKLFLSVSATTTVKVKLSTLKVFSKVLFQLEPKQRERYADVYHSALQSDKLKWRFRLIIVSQMEGLLSLFPLQKVNDFFMPMIIKFCMDECYVVRRNASASFWVLYKKIKEGELDLAKQMIDINFLYFGDYNRFSFRQSFVYMSEGILCHCKELFTQEAAEKLLILSKDPVINVRVSLGRLIQSVRRAGIKIEETWFEQIQENLMLFEDPDVSRLLKDNTSKGRKSELSGGMSISANSQGSGSVLKKKDNKTPKKIDYKNDEEELEEPKLNDKKKDKVEEIVKEQKDVKKNIENENEKDKSSKKEGFQVIGESTEKKGLLANNDEDDIDIVSDDDKDEDEFSEIKEEDKQNKVNEDESDDLNETKDDNLNK